MWAPDAPPHMPGIGCACRHTCVVARAIAESLGGRPPLANMCAGQPCESDSKPELSPPPAAVLELFAPLTLEHLIWGHSICSACQPDADPYRAICLVCVDSIEDDVGTNCDTAIHSLAEEIAIEDMSEGGVEEEGGADGAGVDDSDDDSANKENHDPRDSDDDDDDDTEGGFGTDQNASNSKGQRSFAQLKRELQKIAPTCAMGTTPHRSQWPPPLQLRKQTDLLQPKEPL